MRHLQNLIRDDLAQRMVLLAGPRQVGKTTLAKSIASTYRTPMVLNHDALEHARIIEQRAWLPGCDCLVLDELHKKPDWKNFLKGVYDTKPPSQHLLVTGSARLDTFRQSGESLAGRYFLHHLLPFSVKEWATQTGESAESAAAHLMRFGGFPEPCAAGSERLRQRWQTQYFGDLVREDVQEFGRVQDLRAMRLLLEMLRTRTGSPLSFQSLGRDLQLSPITVRRYVDILEALHIVFLVHPYHHNIARALNKSPKLYFYDWAYLPGDLTRSTDPLQAVALGTKLENMVAVHLLKHLHFLRSSQGIAQSLHYVQTTSGKEVDFVTADEQGNLVQAIEVKFNDSKPSNALKELVATRQTALGIQLAFTQHTPYLPNPTQPRVQAHPVAGWLNALSA